MNYFALILTVVAACWWKMPSKAESGPINVALKNAEGGEIGTAVISPVAKGVRILLDVRGLPPGEHAIHFHEKGSCVAPKFESAGSHFAPQKRAHGFNSKDGAHAGDMANLIIPASGALKVEIINTQVTLGKGSNSLAKKGGTSLVIHAGPDDYHSQPSGNSGDRLACGVITAAAGG